MTPKFCTSSLYLPSGDSGAIPKQDDVSLLKMRKTKDRAKYEEGLVLRRGMQFLSRACQPGHKKMVLNAKQVEKSPQKETAAAQPLPAVGHLLPNLTPASASVERELEKLLCLRTRI